MISQPIYESSNQNMASIHILNSSNNNVPQGTTSPSSALSPNIATPNSAPVPSATASMSSITPQEYAVKLDHLDTSVAAAVAASWPTRHFGGAEIPIGFEPSPEQLIQQQMLSQSRSLIMQNMAARELMNDNLRMTGKHGTQLISH
ncbi:hypothetical protein BG011_004757 [Mortierella polycephala]|uniref:Uncharacterized protein n=1 Tax=Mortierella polycephala TaxID=41804 RepID=A0A9P6U1X1_9FUNG|nr:hypothetical protein BG011_004757 [Mortierella polycephala]